MRNQARCLIWILCAASFTAAMCLAIATAAIKAENVKSRRDVQRAWSERKALEVTLEAEMVEWREATTVERLVEYWQRLERRGRE